MYAFKNILLCFSLGFFSLCRWFAPTPYQIAYLSPHQIQPELLTSLQAFEQQFTYPFSAHETFTINHGTNNDYFSFFTSLGQPYFYTITNTKNRTINKNNRSVALKKDELAAVGCAIHRTMPTKKGTMVKAWYLCDVKVKPAYQGEHLLSLLAKTISFSLFTTCTRGYAICMNPLDNNPKAAHVFKKHGTIPWTTSQQLNLYSLNAEQLKAHYSTLESIFRKHGYLKQHQGLTLTSTSGKKDYLITHASAEITRPWKLVHLTRGDATTKTQELDNEATYMVCAVNNSPVDTDIAHLIGSYSSSAQIISYGMDDIDFNLLTSDQI